MPPSAVTKQKRDILKKLSRGVRDEILGRFPDEVVFDKGAFHLSPTSLSILRSVAGMVMAVGARDDVIKLPNTTERELEAVSLGILLVESLHKNAGSLRFIVPVCPDYSQESSDSFYQTIGSGISPQARAGMRAARFISEEFPKFGFEPKIEILVADTEDDIPEVMDRCVSGNPQNYKDCCLISAAAIKNELPGVLVTTFSQGLGGEFRDAQYEYERVIRKLRVRDARFAESVQKLMSTRTQRHAKILGRDEVDCELTIRYMAQYATLGTLVRRLNEPTILLNYPTTNLPFYNAATYQNSEFSLSRDDLKVVPVMETVL